MIISPYGFLREVFKPRATKAHSRLQGLHSSESDQTSIALFCRMKSPRRTRGNHAGKGEELYGLLPSPIVRRKRKMTIAAVGDRADMHKGWTVTRYQL